MNPNTHVTRIG